MSNATETRPMIRASVSDIALTAEFLSLLFDAPVVITSAHNEVSTPGGPHLVMIVAESAT